jgi:hypothetical protein
MKFCDIDKDAKVFPGEYILYEPKNQIVLCGAFNRKENFIRVLHNGRLLQDKIENFKKIELSKKERKQKTGGCKKCGKSNVL